jgi:hypothetical protein
MRDSLSGQIHLSIKLAFYILVVALPLPASAQDRYSRCTSDPSGFARDENLNSAATQYLDNIKREIDFSENLSRMSGMAGLGDRAMEARSRALQYRQQLQQTCAQISQSIGEAEQRQQRAESDRVAASQANKAAERQREAVIEYELNRRVPGAASLMQESDFWNWLNVSQGKTLRRDVWDQAISTEKFDRAAQ